MATKEQFDQLLVDKKKFFDALTEMNSMLKVFSVLQDEVVKVKTAVKIVEDRQEKFEKAASDAINAITKKLENDQRGEVLLVFCKICGLRLV
jgi:hypothetical protein